ncbi:Imm49 family immunity protein [uncultured Shewanella sp.]|uniref:Imm49 family immunity protein n=1 Tax=uncultured Shewanella sp. TaxID=173975 RepID=UPI00261627F1|nr:Imm49 family immunity protein [uncultured Shewanella sp.]
MLKLNKAEIDFERLFRRAPMVLEKRIPHIQDKSLDISVRLQATFVVASKYIELAYANYVLEEYEKVKPYLQQAAPYAFLRGFDPLLQTQKVDWTIQEEMNIVLLFGTPELLAQLRDCEWSLTDNEIINQACYLYDHLLLKIGTGVLPSASLIEAALTEAKNTKDKDVLQYILPLIEAIKALVEGDKATWQANIDKAITWHTEQCQFGDLKDMEQGFMCLNALTMAKLGQELHQWSCTTQSLYLPLFLIAKDA